MSGARAAGGQGGADRRQAVRPRRAQDAGLDQGAERLRLRGDERLEVIDPIEHEA